MRDPTWREETISSPEEASGRVRCRKPRRAEQPLRQAGRLNADVGHGGDLEVRGPRDGSNAEDPLRTPAFSVDQRVIVPVGLDRGKRAYAQDAVDRARIGRPNGSRRPSP